MPKTVFISHASQDKPAVEALANALRERGHTVWLDKYELSPQVSFIRQINDGLERADAGIVVFSAHANESTWVQAELDALLYAHLQEGQPLIPVKLDEDAPIPPLLRPLLYRLIHEHDAISDALDNRTPIPKDVDVQAARTDRVRIRLDMTKNGGIAVAVTFNDQPYAEATYDALPTALVQGREGFLRGVQTGVRRDADTATRSAMTQNLHALGDALRAFCLPDAAHAALIALLKENPVGGMVEVWFEAADPELLGLPFEALRLDDGRVLAVVPEVVMLRRVTDLKPLDFTPLAGPLKILVAVGAPDEDLSSAAVLDHEREVQNILDATEQAHRSETAQVRILEVGSPEAIAEALARDAYHVLHLSCHGNKGVLLLETEDGEERKVTPTDLLEPIREQGRTLPLVVLNACHGGVPDAQTGSFAQALLDAGVPCVLAMQTSVSDYYATELATEFYRVLYRREHQRPSRALAKARKALEKKRQQALQHDAPLYQTQPEYATPTLFVRDETEPRLADFGLNAVPLATPPVYTLAGPVPQLRRDDFIGRRKPLRTTLRTLRTDTAKAGVVLTGIGGVGKSALAGRAMRRLAESGYVPVAFKGVWDLGQIAMSVGLELLKLQHEQLQHVAQLLLDGNQDDRLRLNLLQQVLAAVPLLLVLDDFEQNLSEGGGAFRDDAVADYLQMLAQNARTGRLLLTCRYPLPAPGLAPYFQHVPLGPLSDAEARKLMRRLPSFKDLDPREWARILRLVGGHPRMLEFVDALLNRGKGRLPAVETKLQKILAEEGLDADAAVGDVDAAVQQAVLVGARDVLLEQLVDLADAADAHEALHQLAVSNLPVSPAGLAHMLADAEPTPAQVDAAREALRHLTALSLAYRIGPDAGAGDDRDAAVHRWTAEGLAQRSDKTDLHARATRAGRYRLWRVQHESQSIVDGMEAVRNFLAGQSYDDASREAIGIIRFFQSNNQTTMVALVAGEVLETLPAEQGDYGVLVDQEARAHLALGFTDRAMERYDALLRLFEQRVTDHPDRADYQRDLSVSYERMGDLYRALGQGDEARQAYQASLDIRERLAQAEPDRADYQRDLSVSYNKMGDLYRALGQGNEARQAYQASLDIRERLAQAEPDRADYQRDLSVSYNKMGDLYRALGQGNEARQAYQASLDIAERLAQAEPDRADYQRDLSVSYERMGDLYRALGQGDEARQAYQASLDIRERLAQAEPDRADYQRDLSVSYNKMGDLYRALGQGNEARQAYQASLDIAERLAQAEPDRADYQRDLSVSYERMGDLYRALGQGNEARQAYQASLDIRERLAQAEPDRADYQRDLSVSYERMGDLYRALGQGNEARQAYQASLDIRERLAQAEPDRADYQRDLSVSYERMGDLYRALGQGNEARQAYQASLDIRERLAQAEPDRADYQRDLSVSYNKMGDLYRALGQGNEARQAYQASLDIAERLAQAEPDRADYQRDLSVSYTRLAQYHLSLNEPQEAFGYFLKDLQIAERLAQAEPGRADYQVDLAISLIQTSPFTDKRKELLTSALQILTTLQEEGRLDPSRAGMIERIQTMLEEG